MKKKRFLLGINGDKKLFERIISQGGIDGIILGSETCVFDLPDEEALKRIILPAKKEGLSISLMLPPFSEFSKSKILSLVEKFLEFEGEEIILNDLNGIALLSSKKIPFSVGRLPFEFNVDPYLRKIKSDLPWQQYGRHRFNLQTVKFFQKLGAKRIYLSPFLPLPEILNEPQEIEYGIIGPSIYITSTFLCPLSDINRINKGKSLAYPRTCSRFCSSYSLHQFKTKKGINYYLYGNAIYDKTDLTRAEFLLLPSISAVAQWPPIKEFSEIWK